MLDHLRTPARILVATLMGAALFVSAPAAAQDVHGAIAFGTETEQSNGVAYGFAWNFLAKDAAHAEAMKACISSGGTNCIQLAWFQDGCGALAMDQHGNAQGKPGMTREQAEARALRTCEAARRSRLRHRRFPVHHSGRRAGHLFGKRKRSPNARCPNHGHRANN